MQSDKDMIKTVLCVLIIVFSLFFISMSEVPEASSAEGELIMVDVSNNEDLKGLSDFDIVDHYGQKALIRADELERDRLLDEGFHIDELPARTKISVRGYEFDVFEGEPDISSNMKIDSYPSGEEGLYLIHMLGPINPEWNQELRDKGVDIINYVPNYAYEVSMTPEQAEMVEDLFFVDWVGIYHPAYRMPDDIEPGLVNARFINEPDREDLIERGMRTTVINSKELDNGGKTVTFNASSRGVLKDWARTRGLYHISNTVEPELHSEVETQTIGGGLGFMDDEHDDPDIPYRKHGDYGAYINQIGYSGEGVTLAIADTGIGDGTPGYSGHLDLTGRVKGGHGFGDLDPDDWGDGHGHGTHVIGSAAGDSYHGSGETGEYPGFGNYLMGQGLAYESELYAAKIFGDGGEFLAEEFYPILEIPKQESDAYIHMNSWGSATFGEYTELDSVFDQAVRDADRETDHNEPMVITASAGNSGPIEQSTGSPGNAKNIITVGSTQSYMPDGRDYGGRDTDDISMVSRFSSRGWTEDNRIKPDVVAPGENVLSLGSPRLYDRSTYDWKSGTSMSNPAVAGAASVVVEWFEEEFGEKPSPAMVRSILINTAEDLQDDGCRNEHIPNKDEGWGMVDISKLEYPIDDPVPFSVVDESETIQTGDVHEYELSADRLDEPLKITLAWTDKNAEEGDEIALKNDLNLEVTSPSGETYRGNAFRRGWSQADSNAIDDFDMKRDGWDDVNNVQNVYIDPNEIEEGDYTISVEGFNVPLDGTNDGDIDQDYALTIYNSEGSDMETTRGSQVTGQERVSRTSHEEDEHGSEYTERDPIQIPSDLGFEVLADQNGWPGSGTEDDPFIIEDYAIDGEGSNFPIHIEDVRVHFIIRNNRFYNADRNSRATSDHSGIYLSNTTNGIIRDNEMELNSYGLLVEESFGNIIEDNTALNNHVGFHLLSSEDNKLENNVASKYSHPVYGDGVLLEGSEENTIVNNQVVNNNNGIMVRDSHNNEFRENLARHNSRGIRLHRSEMNQIKESEVSHNNFYGIDLLGSDNNELVQIESNNNDNHGIYIRNSEQNLIDDSELKANRGNGIRFFSAQNNTVLDNKISESGSSGLTLSNSYNHDIYGNEFMDDGINFIGSSVEFWNSHDIPLNNTVEGRSIRYLKDVEGGAVEEEAGQIILANSSGVIIEDHNINVGGLGIILGFSDHNEILGNTVREQRESITLRHSHGNILKDNNVDENLLGLYIVRSKRNTISENTLSRNTQQGLVLSSSDRNLVFGNEILNNDILGMVSVNSFENTIYHNHISYPEGDETDERSLAFDSGVNRWDHGQQGNHWSNYEERYPEASEVDGKGYWDIPYNITDGESEDRYPLTDTDFVDDFSVFILDPNDNETVFSSEATVRWSTKGEQGDVESSIRKNGGEWKEVGDRNEYTYQDLDDGVYQVEVRAKDEEDISYHNISFVVNTGVYVEITSPEEGEVRRRSRVTVEWTAHNKITQEIKLEGPGQEEDWEQILYMDERTFTDLEDGDYEVFIRAYDEQGNSYTDQVEFSIRTVDIDIGSPEIGDMIMSPNVQITWSSENAESHEIRVCGGRWDRIGDVQEYELRDLRAGDYEVSVRARDEAGLSSIDRVSFTISPVVEISSPRHGEVFNTNELTVEWEHISDEFDIQNYEIRLDDGDWISTDMETHKTFSNLSDGEHFVEVRALLEDDFQASDQISFIVDTTPPTVNITSPEDGESLEGDSLRVTWEGYDEITQIVRYEIRIDDGEWIKVGIEEEYTFEDLEAGEYRVEVRAYDRAGNENSDTITIELEEDTISFRIRDYWWLITIVSVLMVIALDIGVWRKNSDRTPSKLGSLKELEEELQLYKKDDDEMEEEYKL